MQLLASNHVHCNRWGTVKYPIVTTGKNTAKERELNNIPKHRKSVCYDMPVRSRSSERQPDVHNRLQHVVPIGIFLAAFFYSSFFLQGLRLFDNDYNQWLRYAREYSFPSILGQIFNPILYDWNVDFRPTEILIFKGLFSFFGYAAPGYYYFKSLLLAIFAATYFVFLRRYLDNVAIAALSALFVIVAESSFASLMWVSDFAVLSELLALIVYGIFLHLEATQDTPNRVLIFSLASIAIVTLICDRTKANGKLIPAVLFLYVIASDWRKLKKYGWALAVMVITILPWKVLIDNPAPFLYAKGGTVKPYAWQPASLVQFWNLFGADFQPWSLIHSGHPPVSVLGIIGFPILYAFIVAMFILKLQPIHVDNTVRLLIIWAFINIAALASYPSLPVHFQARYAIGVLVPTIPLLLLAISNAAYSMSKDMRIAQTVMAVLMTTPIALHCYYTFQARNDFPTLMIASDTLREYVAQHFTNTSFFYLNSPVMAFRPADDRNEFFTSLDRDINTVASQVRSKSNLYVISFFPLKESFLDEPLAFPGKSNALYDRMFNTGSAGLYKYTFYLYKVKL